MRAMTSMNSNPDAAPITPPSRATPVVAACQTNKPGATRVVALKTSKMGRLTLFTRRGWATVNFTMEGWRAAAPQQT